MSKVAQPDHLVISKAVSEWYRTTMSPGMTTRRPYCAMQPSNSMGGCRSVDEMATVLIETYVGLAATRVNSPSSDAIH